MQIVRELAGYTLGRSDLVRRAMAKKKASVMEKERQNFIYGNEKENVPGCIANGIDEKVASKIYDDMIDFAKYAFNKSHAACYAVVAIQTAYLKEYYPVEFMAALMTSVIANATKVAEYILICRQMGIKILPPDINEGESAFSVSDGSIRYGLSAIKNLGKPVIDAIVTERETNGKFKNIRDFIERMSGNGVNKRNIESFIKAGALDSLGANRRQMMCGYGPIVDNISVDKKNSIEGQMDLFSLMSEDDKADYDVKLPDMEEYTKEEILGFEKEVLGVYLSGHPLDAYEGMWKKNISAMSSDFEIQEDTNEPKVADNQKVVIGGMLSEKTVKNTKTGKQMAFLTIEDLVGTVEVIVFPRDYELNRNLLEEDRKLFIIGKATVREEEKGKVICEKIIPFDKIPRECWVKFADKAAYEAAAEKLNEVIRQSDGNDTVVIYCEKEKAVKYMPKSMSVEADREFTAKLSALFSEENVRVVEKSIENYIKKD